MIPVPDPELRRLADKLLDEGGLSAPEIDRLSEIVKEPAALDWFLSVVQQEALLREVIPTYVAARRPVRFPAAKMIRFAAGAVAMLALGVGLGALAFRGSTAKTAPGDVRVTALIGVRWAGSETRPDLLDGGVALGRLALDAGLAELTYGNGVRVTIQGPCDYSVAGANAGRLAFGKLVAHVPHGAEGFRVDYARGRIVDLGTEFAMDITRDGTGDIGVFEGKIEVHHGDRKMLPLFANQAVAASTATGDDSLQAIPLDRDKFIRQVPSRDFRWEVRDGATLKFEADVSHLVWKSSDYRILFKCFQGASPLRVQGVKLLCDGRVVAEDAKPGALNLSHGSLRELRVTEKDFARGRWTVEAEIAAAGDPQPGSVVGIMQFEEGLVKEAQAKDFAGAWRYAYYGHRYVRVFEPDGRIILYRDGEPDRGYKPGTWTCVDGVLTAREGDGKSVETHVLRDKDTLVFTNRPYENAKRTDGPPKK